MFSRIASRTLLQKRAPLNILTRPSIRHYSEGPPALDKPTIEGRVLQLLRDFEKVAKEKVTVDAHFINDLGLDSLDQVEITMGLEVSEWWF
jgi:NADH dehydrogenase (ubiquinone) 1 alpha/beta subcomplex 1